MVNSTFIITSVASYASKVTSLMSLVLAKSLLFMKQTFSCSRLSSQPFIANNTVTLFFTELTFGRHDQKYYSERKFNKYYSEKKSRIFFSDWAAVK